MKEIATYQQIYPQQGKEKSAESRLFKLNRNDEENLSERLL